MRCTRREHTIGKYTVILVALRLAPSYIIIVNIVICISGSARPDLVGYRIFVTNRSTMRGVVD